MAPPVAYRTDVRGESAAATDCRHGLFRSVASFFFCGRIDVQLTLYSKLL